MRTVHCHEFYRNLLKPVGKVSSSHRIFLHCLHAVNVHQELSTMLAPPPTPHPWRHRTLAKCDVQHGKKIHITRKRVTADSDILTCLSFVQSCPACRTHGISPSVIWETGCYVQTKHNGTLANESHTGSSTVAQHGMAFTKHNKHGTVSLRSPVSTQSSIKRLILHISLKLVNSLR